MKDIMENKEIPDICKSHGINYLALFGSRVRGDFKPDSDVDLLVKFNRIVSLLELSRAENALKDSLNLPVDLVMADGLRSVLRPYVEKDLKVIYAEE